LLQFIRVAYTEQTSEQLAQQRQSGKRALPVGHLRASLASDAEPHCSACRYWQPVHSAVGRNDNHRHVAQVNREPLNSGQKTACTAVPVIHTVGHFL